MLPDITRLKSRFVYENRWMRVREDQVARRDGSHGIYGVVEKPDFVTIAALEGQRLHLVQQYRYPVQGRYWEFPQGSWEHAPGTDPLEVARAELHEETGLEASRMEYVGHLFLAYGYSTQGYHVFLANGLSLGRPDRDHEEQDLITRTFAIDDVEQMLRDGAIKDATTVATFGLLRLKQLI